MGSLSPTTFEFSYDEIAFSRSASCGPREVVTSASTSFSNQGVYLSWSGGTFTVGGTFRKVFPESYWEYIPRYDREKDPPPSSVSISTQSTAATLSEIPATIFALLSGTHNPTISYPITYTVNTLETIPHYVPEVPGIPGTPATDTSPGTPGTPGTPAYTYYTYEYHTYTISHKVCNNWGIFKGQLNNVISRGDS